MQTVPLKGKSGRQFDVGLVLDAFPVQWMKNRTEAVPVYDSRFIDYFVDWLRFRVKNGHDNIIHYTGERRAGKSSLACQVGLALDEAFPVEHFTFSAQDFNKILASNPRADAEAGIYPQAALDEAGYDLYAGEWMKLVVRNMVKKFQVIGEKRQTVHMVLPHRMKLVKGVREDTAKFWLYVETMGDEEVRGLATLRYGRPNPWHEESYWEPQACFLFDEMRGAWWDAYMVRKQAFIDMVAESELASEHGATPRAQTAIRQRNAAIQLLHRKLDMSYGDLADALAMPRSSVSRILAALA